MKALFTANTQRVFECLSAIERMRQWIREGVWSWSQKRSVAATGQENPQELGTSCGVDCSYLTICKWTQTHWELKPKQNEDIQPIEK